MNIINAAMQRTDFLFDTEFQSANTTDNDQNSHSNQSRGGAAPPLHALLDCFNSLRFQS